MMGATDVDVGVHRGHINQDKTLKQAVLVIPVWRKEREKKKAESWQTKHLRKETKRRR